MKLQGLEKAQFNSAVNRINTQLRMAKTQGWVGLAQQIEEFLLPYQTTRSGYLSQKTDNYDSYDINKIKKYSTDMFYLSKHKAEIAESFPDLPESEYKSKSAEIARIKENFADYIKEYYKLIMDNFSDALLANRRLTFFEMSQITNLVEGHLNAESNQGFKRTVSFWE